MVDGVDYCQTCHRDVKLGGFRRVVIIDKLRHEPSYELAVCAMCQRTLRMPDAKSFRDIPKVPGSVWRAAYG